MKKFITLCLTLAMSATVLCACSNSVSDTEKTNNTSSKAKTEASETATEATQSGIALDDSTTEKGSYIARGGTDLYIPEGFEEELAYGYCIYSKKFGNDTIYFGFRNHNLYSTDNDVNSYSLEDVPDIEAERFVDTVYEVMKHYTSKNESTVDSESKEVINDLDFIIRKGTMNIEYKEPEDTHNLKYVALYTLYDNKYYTKIPTSMFFFSDCYDDGTEAEMERIAREVANKTDWVIEYN